RVHVRDVLGQQSPRLRGRRPLLRYGNHRPDRGVGTQPLGAERGTRLPRHHETSEQTGRGVVRVPFELRRELQRGIVDVLTRQRSEEHTSELQSRENLVCRLLLEKKKHTRTTTMTAITSDQPPKQYP